MSVAKNHSSIRRSFALPPLLVQEALRLAPPELRHNLNRLVKTALEAYIKARRERELDRAMEAMAHDMALLKESRAINKEFEGGEQDGLAP